MIKSQKNGSVYWRLRWTCIVSVERSLKYGSLFPYLGNSMSLTSPLTFDWLLGYEKCGTGWDRFSKPSSCTTPVSEGLPGKRLHVYVYSKCASEYMYLRDGRTFPSCALLENWPWGYIITPNPEGNMEFASKKGSFYTLQAGHLRLHLTCTFTCTSTCMCNLFMVFWHVNMLIHCTMYLHVFWHFHLNYCYPCY